MNIEAICKRTGFSYEELKAKNREEEYAFARYIIWAHLFRLGMTQRQIAELFDRDRSNIYNGLKRFQEMQQTQTPIFAHKMYLKFKGYRRKQEDFTPFVY
jgi:chromosomal replication initiation ATPase DnaA